MDQQHTYFQLWATKQKKANTKSKQNGRQKQRTEYHPFIIDAKLYHNSTKKNSVFRL